MNRQQWESVEAKYTQIEDSVGELLAVLRVGIRSPNHEHAAIAFDKMENLHTYLSEEMDRFRKRWSVQNEGT